MESYLLMSLKSGCLKQDLFYINFRCLYSISMHQMEQRFLFCLMLMIVSIGIPLKILENCL